MSTQTSAPKLTGVADICFLIDATGSMQHCIDSIKANLRTFIDTLLSPSANGGVLLKDWRACVWGYRDYIYDDRQQRLVRNPFTSDPLELENQLQSLKASGGGPAIEESLLDALFELCQIGYTGPQEAPQNNMWRYSSAAARCIVVISDAPFHPTMTIVENGDIDTLLPLLMQERFRITIYAPDHACYNALASGSRIVFDPVYVPENESPVEALRNFTSNTQAFRKTLEALAKSVSQSSSIDTQLL